MYEAENAEKATAKLRMIQQGLRPVLKNGRSKPCPFVHHEKETKKEGQNQNGINGAGNLFNQRLFNVPAR